MLINEAAVSYTNGLASSGSGFRAAILLEVEQLARIKITRKISRKERNHNIFLGFK